MEIKKKRPHMCHSYVYHNDIGHHSACMAINLSYIISRKLDTLDGAGYSFSEYPQGNEQFAALFTKIGATLFL